MSIDIKSKNQTEHYIKPNWYPTPEGRNMAQLLSDTEITENLGQVPNWALYGKEIQLVRTFKNFVEAIAFVNQLVEPAETAGHHPDIAISYNKVTISLTTHDAGGLTNSDFELAAAISELS